MARSGAARAAGAPKAQSGAAAEAAEAPRARSGAARVAADPRERPFTLPGILVRASSTDLASSSMSSWMAPSGVATRLLRVDSNPVQLVLSEQDDRVSRQRPLFC